MKVKCIKSLTVSGVEVFVDSFVALEESEYNDEKFYTVTVMNHSFIMTESFAKLHFDLSKEYTVIYWEDDEKTCEHLNSNKTIPELKKEYGPTCCIIEGTHTVY